MASGYLVALSVVAGITILVGSGASILLIWLLREIDIWTDHSTLIYYMAIGQLIYCLMFYKDGLLGISSTTSVREIVYVMNCIGTAGLIASFIFSSILSFMVLYMIKKKKLLTLQKLRCVLYSVMLLVLSTFVGAVLLGLTSRPVDWGLVHGTFYAAEVLLCIPIVFNFGCYIACWLSLDTLISESRSIGMNAMMYSQGKALETLVNRIKWYPIVQSISRALMIWYTSNIKWGGHLGDYDGVSYLEKNVDIGRFSVQITSFLAVLVAPVGFLRIFLKMQPHAKKYLKLHIKIAIHKICNCSSNDDAEELEALVSEKTRVLGLLRQSKKIRTGIISESHDSGPNTNARFISTSSSTSNKRGSTLGNTYRNSVTSSYLLIPASTTSSSQDPSFRYYTNPLPSQSTENSVKSWQPNDTANPITTENDPKQPLLPNADLISMHHPSGEDVNTNDIVDWSAMSDVDLLSIVAGHDNSGSEVDGDTYVL